MIVVLLGIFSLTQAKEFFDYPIIGIDLGTTYSSVCISRNDKVEIIPNGYGAETTPTVIAFNGTFLIGEDAKEQAIINPKNTFYDIKRLIGRKSYLPDVVNLKNKLTYTTIDQDNRTCIKVSLHQNESDKLYSINQIQALVLKRLQNLASSYLGVKVKNAVITVPVCFDDAQKQATKDIAEIAGLNVVRLISEPRAAAIAYGKNSLKKETNIFVFDFGGGTLDTTVLIAAPNRFEEVNHSAVMDLGGEDFDFNIVSYLLNKVNESTQIDLTNNKRVLQILKTEASRVKETLSSQQIAHIRIQNLIEGYNFNYSLTRDQFVKINEELFEKIIGVINSTFLISPNMSIKDIDEVILVGGSSRIPKVQQIVETIFSGKKIIKDRIQDELICVGAAIYANSLTKQEQQNYQFEEILKTSISYGTQTLGGIMDIIIPRLSRYPLTLSKIYTTVKDYQSTLLINVYQGESIFTSLNHKIGDFYLNDIEKAKRFVPEIEIKFSIDDNGMLLASAVDLVTRSSKQQEFELTNLMRTSKDQIDSLREGIEEIEKLDSSSLKLIYKLNLYKSQYLKNLENSNYKNQLTDSDLQKIQEILDSNTKWLKENVNNAKTKFEDFQNQLKHIEESLQVILIRLSQRTEQEGQNKNGDENEDEDIIPEPLPDPTPHSDL